MTNMMWKSGMNESWGLSHIDFFIKETMQKGIFHIQLTNNLVARNSNREN